MVETQSRARLVRFGAFEVDLQTGELRKDGVKLKFSGQPFQVLAILLEHPGDVVTREELQKRLWPDMIQSPFSYLLIISPSRRTMEDSREHAPSSNVERPGGSIERQARLTHAFRKKGG